MKSKIHEFHEIGDTSIFVEVAQISFRGWPPKVIQEWSLKLQRQKNMVKRKLTLKIDEEVVR